MYIGLLGFHELCLSRIISREYLHVEIELSFNLLISSLDDRKQPQP
jgi:hypothetical protein